VRYWPPRHETLGELILTPEFNPFQKTKRKSSMLKAARPEIVGRGTQRTLVEPITKQGHVNKALEIIIYQ